MDAILEIEKCNAAQQLTAMIILPSTVNVISNEEIAVFNAKNQNTLHDIVLALGAMNVMNTVISSWTAYTKYLLPEHQ